MSAVSETIVREYFELNEFLVRQHRKHTGPGLSQQEDDIDFFVLNPQPRKAPGQLPFVLANTDLAFVDRAIVVVRGWHTERFSAAVLSAAPRMFRFVEPKVFQRAAKAFGLDQSPLKILVVPALPHAAEGREQTITLLRSKGVDAIIPFSTMLADLVGRTKTNLNYQKSDLLQIIRILKKYDFFKDPQMELFKGGSPRKK
jgi:hypothetical protein